VSIKDRLFWPQWQALICIGRMSGFMGLGKPSKPVTTSLNRTTCFEVVCWGENEALGWWPDRVSLGAKTSPREQGIDFDLVRTSQMVIIRETPWVTRMACWSGSSPARYISIRVTAILSDMSDCLSLLSSHSMSSVLFMVRGWWWLWLYYYYDYCIYLPLTLTWVNVLLVYSCSSL
jgi:hypothetical protein